MHCRITLNWVGGEDEFALPLGQLRALQTHLNCGPEELLRRIGLGTYRVDDLIEVLRQGLIGAGVAANVAGPKVLQLFETYPLVAFRDPAWRVLQAALVGVDGDPVGELPGAEASPGLGAGPASTGPEQ